mgnify:FL=1
MDRLERAINRVVERMVAVYEAELAHERDSNKLSQDKLRDEYQAASQTMEGMDAFSAK